MEKAPQTYKARVETFQHETTELNKKAFWFPWARAVTFLGGLGLLIYGGKENIPFLLWSGVFLLLVFAVVVVLHRSLQRKIEDATLLEKVNQRGVDRCGNTWHDFPRKGTEHLPQDHPYAGDIDVFGRGSLFQRLNTTSTHFGERILAGWLLGKAPYEEISRRQELVKDLKGRLEFRQHLEKEGLRLSDDFSQKDPEPFLSWVESPLFLLNRKHWVWLARLLPIWTVSALLLYQFKPISSLWWFIPFVIQVCIFSYFQKHIPPILGSVAYREKAFTLYASLFSLIEKEPTSDSDPFRQTQDFLSRKGASSVKQMKSLQRIVDLIEIRQSPLIHFPLNLLFLWDVHCLLWLENWKDNVSSDIRQWFEVLGETEALSTFATLAYELPVHSFPTIRENSSFPYLQAKGIGHPLLSQDTVIYNDVSLEEEKPFLLITGSNMSGKSTLLRAIATNASLAYAGGPVCAQSMELSLMQIATSMRITDSLEHGVSYFMAELNRIRRVLAYREKGSLLYLLDEILHGTNTNERRIAAFGIIKALQEANAIGCVTTHDIELAEQCESLKPRIKFSYFVDEIKDEQMTFSYKLHDGICPTTNAIKLMRLIGISIPVEESPEN